MLPDHFKMSIFSLHVYSHHYVAPYHCTEKQQGYVFMDLNLKNYESKYTLPI